MSDWRTTTTRVLRTIASKLPPDNSLRRGVSKLWTRVLNATGEHVNVRINGQDWLLLNQFRKFAASYEPEAFRLWSRLIEQGDTVWDVGANIGLYSMAAAQHVGSSGRVLSWEPTPKTFSILSSHVGANSPNGICRMIQEAISDFEGELTFNIQADPSSNRIGGQASSIDSVQVAVHTLDHWVKQEKHHPNVVKIDIEGAEVLAFRSADLLLGTARPVILAAIHPQFMHDYGAGPETITAVLDKHKYVTFDMEGRPSRPEIYGEFVLLPKERAEQSTRLFM